MLNRLLIALAVVLAVGLIVASVRLQDSGMPQTVELAVTPEPPKELPPDVAKRLQEEAAAQLKEMEANAEVWTVAGPETMGSVIQVADKQIQLPPDVYVEAYIIEGECVAAPCAELPYYLLQYKDSPKDILGVTVNSGAIVETYKAPEEQRRLRERFAWLEEALK